MRGIRLWRQTVPARGTSLRHPPKTNDGGKQLVGRVTPPLRSRWSEPPRPHSHLCLLCFRALGDPRVDARRKLYGPGLAVVLAGHNVLANTERVVKVDHGRDDTRVPVQLVDVQVHPPDVLLALLGLAARGVPAVAAVRANEAVSRGERAHLRRGAAAFRHGECAPTVNAAEDGVLAVDLHLALEGLAIEAPVRDPDPAQLACRRQEQLGGEGFLLGVVDAIEVELGESGLGVRGQSLGSVGRQRHITGAVLRLLPP